MGEKSCEKSNNVGWQNFPSNTFLLHARQIAGCVIECNKKISMFSTEPPWKFTFSMQYPWSFHGSYRGKCHGKFRSFPCKFMVFHATLWFHGVSMELRENSTEPHGTPRNSVDTHGCFHGTTWASVEFRGISLSFHGVPWCWQIMWRIGVYCLNRYFGNNSGAPTA